MTWVKICGVTTLEDALGCAAAGADAIGLNLWPKSPRSVALAAARAIARALPSGVERVAVLVDPSAEELEALLREPGFDRVQLCGDEPPALGARLGRRLVRTVRLGGRAALARVAEAPPEALVLLDADAPGYGGSGRAVDHELAREAAALRPVVLAGGLTPETVAAAVARVRPFGVDVASGVELAPGRKDLGRVRAFVQAAKGAGA